MSSQQSTGVPEKAVEALALDLAGECGERTIKDGAGRYERDLLDRARRLLQAPADLIRKQGADQERQRADSILGVVLATVGISPTDEMLVEYGGDTEAIERAVQVALQAEARSERQRLKEALFSELESGGWNSDGDIPAEEVKAALDRVIERAALDTQEADHG